jgi:membrane protein implicated in regulation of membrane protease activity
MISMSWWLWVLAGLALLGAELLAPGGFFVFFFGSAALVVGALVILGLGGPVWLQWLLFAALSIVSLLLFRRPLLQWVREREPTGVVDSLEGDVAILQEDLAPGAVGKAELRGTSWSAQNADTQGLTRGQRCRVVRVEGLTLWIRAQ